MSQENLEIVRCIYAAWERGDFTSAEWADRTTSGLDVGQTGTKKAGANLLHVRDGRVRRIVLYWDRERALVDLGVRE